MVIDDNVFIGPNVTFTNDRYPRSKVYPSSFQKTIIRNGASVGANATILGGIVIGAFALIGAGSVVTKSVPDFALVSGNPARITGWVDETGNKLIQSGNEWVNINGGKYKLVNDKLIPV
jgi:acetyltransferase-like isoleucine patch superfamily enzyme